MGPVGSSDRVSHHLAETAVEVTALVLLAFALFGYQPPQEPYGLGVDPLDNATVDDADRAMAALPQPHRSAVRDAIDSEYDRVVVPADVATGVDERVNREGDVPTGSRQTINYTVAANGTVHRVSAKPQRWVVADIPRPKPWDAYAAIAAVCLLAGKTLLRAAADE